MTLNALKKQSREVKNFADGAVKMKTRGKNMKLKEIQGTRDLLGRLLYLATSSNIDLKLVFHLH